MIVEDHVMLAEALASLFKKTRRFQVVGTATSVRDALALIEGRRPDVVLADMSLEDGNAIDLLRAFKRTGLQARTLVLTGFPHGISVSEVMAAGAAGYVLKGQPVTEVLGAIEKVAAGDKYISPALEGAANYRHAGTKSGDLLGRLTPREKMIFRLVVTGGITKVIARDLGLSAKTVETHRTNINRKLGVRSTAALLRFAVAHGIDIGGRAKAS